MKDMCIYKEEAFELIGIWLDEVIQQELEVSQRNQHIYKKICKILKEKWYDRTWKHFREKMKKLRKQYKDVVDHLNETGRG